MVGHYFIIFFKVIDLALCLVNSLFANFHCQIGVIHDFIDIYLEIDCYRQSYFVTSIKIPGGGISLLIGSHAMLLDIVRLLLSGHLNRLVEHITNIHVDRRFLFRIFCLSETVLLQQKNDGHALVVNLSSILSLVCSELVAFSVDFEKLVEHFYVGKEHG